MATYDGMCIRENGKSISPIRASSSLGANDRGVVRRVLVPDFPGTGRTPQPSGIFLQGMALGL